MKANLLTSSLLLLFGALLPVPVAAADYLLIAKEVDGRCDVSVWSPVDRTLRNLAHLDDCPERLFVSESSASVFYSNDERIFQISVHGEFEPKAVAKLPDLTFGTFATEAFSRALSDYESMTASVVMQVRNAGITDDGFLWIQAGLVMAGDDDYDFLIKLVDDKWVVEEFMHCGRFGVCEFAAFAKKESSDTSTEIAPAIWHTLIEENPYFVRDERTPGDAKNYWTNKIDRYLDIDGKKVLLEVWTKSGPDTGNTYTAGAVIRHSNGETFVICDTQCWATLMDQFLLARRFWGGTLELYDIATGKSVLGELKLATWARFPKHPETLP